MIDITVINLHTAKAVKNFNIDYTKFNTVEELREEIKKQRYLKHKDKYREYYRLIMVEKYKQNPDKYREMRLKSRHKMLEENPEYKDKLKDQCRKYYQQKKLAKLKQLNFPITEKKDDESL